MITTNEYLSPEFLYFVAIQRQSILIYPFDYLKHLQPLLDLMDEWYIVEPMDGAALNHPDNFEVFLAQSNEFIPEEKPWLFVIENMTQTMTKLFSKYPQSLFLGITEDVDLNPQDGMVVLYNKKLQTFDPVNSDQINKSLPGNPLLAWCTDIVDVVMQQSINEAKTQMREIREVTKELFELVTDFSIAGYSAMMTPFSFHEQKVIIHLCERRYQIQLQDILPTEKELREFAESQKVIADELIHTDDMDVHMDVIPEQEPLKKEENKNLTEDKPYLQEIIAIEGNRNIDLAFMQAIRLVPLSSPKSKTITTPEAKYVALRKSEWKNGIPSEFFNDLLLIHVREIVKINPTAVSQFQTVLHEEFLQILNIFGKLCPPSFKEFTHLPLPMFFEDPGIMNDLITNPTHVSLPFNHSSRSSSLENVQTFDSFAFSPGQTEEEKPQQDRKVKTELTLETTFQELWDRTFLVYDSTFSLLDPHTISKLEAETLRLATHLTQVTHHDNTRT